MCRGVRNITIISFLVLTCVCFAEIPLNISGQMQTALWYAPETEFKTNNYIYLTTVFKTDSSPRFDGRFAWKFQSTERGFDAPFDKLLTPAISRSTIEINGPIYFQLPGYKITAGNASFNLSPHIAQNNYDNAVGLRGYTVTNLMFAGIKFDGFYGWHPAVLDKAGFGLKGQKKINNYTFTAIGAGTREKRKGNESGWNYLDQALLSELNIRRRSGSINAIIAANKKEDNLYWIRQFIITGRIINFLQYELDLFDFDKEYDPTYRNRQKEYIISGFNPYYYGINPLDKYTDRLGGKIRFTGNFKSTPTKVEYGVYKLKSKEQLVNRIIVEQEHRLKKWGCRTYLDYELQKDKTEINNTTKVAITAENKSPLVFVPGISFSAISSRANNLALEMILGITSQKYGVKLFGGFGTDNGVFQKKVLGEITSPLGFTVSLGFSSPNTIEDEDFYYDKDGKLIYRDNFFLIKHSLFF